MDEETTRVVEPRDIPLIAQPHGGAMAPPFQPGQSGNPKGRPKDEERLLAMMLRQAPDALERAAKRLAEVLDDPSSRHWLGALKEVTDRREGPVASQTHHHVSTDRAIVTHAQAGPAPELPGLPEPDKALPSADISTDESSAQ